LVAFHVSESVAYRRFVLGAANTIFIASYLTDVTQVLPLIAFLALGYVCVFALYLRQSSLVLASGVVAILCCYVFLKRFSFFEGLGQLPFPYLTIGLSYVTLLSIVGIMMITESVRAILRARQGKPAELRRPGSHMWIHGLPFKIRFKQSKIYVSAIPVWTIGFLIGFIGAVMGIGGGFLLVPALIYLMRVPTGVVVGTSMFLTLVTMSGATVMHAATNHLVDAVLALILMVGGVTGAQFGARAGQRIRGEQLRLLLGLLVFLVGLRFAFDLVLRPDELFSVRLLEYKL
jgi:uncharacterized membrane protein YfcA